MKCPSVRYMALVSFYATTTSVCVGGVGDKTGVLFKEYHFPNIQEVSLNKGVKIKQIGNLEQLPNLHTVIAYGIGLGDDETKKFEPFRCLSKLYLRGNRIGDEGIQWIASNTTITNFDLAVNALTAASCESIARNTTIKFLNVSYNDLKDEGAVVLARNTTITDLDIRGIQAYDKGIVAVAGCRSIKKLSFTDYQFENYRPRWVQNLIANLYVDDIPEADLSKAAIDALANSAIEHMVMDGYEAPCSEIVSRHTCLRKLDLQQEINEGVAMAITTCTTLTRLDAMSVDGDAMQELAENGSLQHIHSNYIKVHKDAAEALENNKTLLYLSVTCRLFTSHDALKTLTKCTSLMKYWNLCQYNGTPIKSVSLKKRVEENQQRVSGSLRVFTMALGFVFKLKANTLKRVRSQ